jgi:NADPH:quinone reductase-like Zn-dependent oxidoreductase
LQEKRKMKAVFIEQFGDSHKLQYGEKNMPQLRPGQVLVRVRAAGVNPRDWIVREGKYAFQFVLPKLPLILGSDISGEIVQLGEGVKMFSVGQEVFGMQPLNGAMGAYAEYIAIDESALAVKPSNISHIEAAAVPCAGLTAWQAIVEIGKVKPGDLVTVCGGSGGVGSYAIQFAKNRGAWVNAVCGPASATLVKKIGADEIIDYKQIHYTKVVKSQDVVFDAVGRDKFSRAKRVLQSSGRYISTIPSPSTAFQAVTTNVLRALSLGNSRSSHLVLVRACGKQLNEIAKLMKSGQVKSVIDSVYPLSEARQAQERSRTWHAKGKIVLEVD